MRLIRILGLAVLGLSVANAAIAGVFTSKAGETFEGSLYKAHEGFVYFQFGLEKVENKRSSFDAEPRKAIKAWVSENSQAVDVHSERYLQPRIVASSLPRLPEQYWAEAFKGMVSVDLVFDDRGRVIHASIPKWTHDSLESPSLEAAKTWIFEPAQVKGRSVKSRLRVPFRFVNTPPASGEAVAPAA